MTKVNKKKIKARKINNAIYDIHAMPVKKWVEAPHASSVVTLRELIEPIMTHRMRAF